MSESELVADLTASRPVIGILIKDDDEYKIYWADGPITTNYSHGAFLERWRRNFKNLLTAE